MTHELKILNMLLDRYERSGHCLPGKESNRRIMLNLTGGEYKEYRENDPSIAEINHSIKSLESEGLIAPYWREGYEDWLYGRISLNLNSLEKAYSKAGRKPLSETADILLNIIQRALIQIATTWKLRFLKDESARLQNSLRTSRLLPKDTAQVEAITKVLQYTEKGPELMRVISTNCFQDSKYLEQNLLSNLVSIAKAYEPDLVANQALDDELLTQNVVLEQLGILTYPEIFEFCGNAILIFSEGSVNTGVFENGFCLQSENLHNLAGVDISGIQNLYFIENRTNYRYIVRHGIQEDTLVFYHGGFYSPMKLMLFNMISKSAGPNTNFYFWGDIDLGGFLMYTRLKKNIFAELRPWKMGLEDYEAYKSQGVMRSESYIELLRIRTDDKQFDPCFFPVSNAILESKTTVEQEVML